MEAVPRLLVATVTAAVEVLLCVGAVFMAE